MLSVELEILYFFNIYNSSTPNTLVHKNKANQNQHSDWRVAPKDEAKYISHKPTLHWNNINASSSLPQEIGAKGRE